MSVVEGAKRAVTAVTVVTPESTYSVMMVNLIRLTLSAKNFVVRVVLCIFAENYKKNEERDYCTSVVGDN